MVIPTVLVIAKAVIAKAVTAEAVIAEAVIDEAVMITMKGLDTVESLSAGAA